MILSYHPCYVADENRLCAGREPDGTDRAAMAAAAAVILPQGCPKQLFEMAEAACPHVFPDYRVRFRYPGKTGQARLFSALGVPHPPTLAFSGPSDLSARYPHWRRVPPLALPFVFKGDLGGEGDAVFLVDSSDALVGLVNRETGPWGSGFVFQVYVPSGNRVLRVAKVGKRVVSYWRIQDGPARFSISLARGASLDAESDPGLQEVGREAVAAFCRETRINLAGFDLLFSTAARAPSPLFLEINWFFGRRGLGGSAAFYDLLTAEINRWLADLGLRQAGATPFNI